MKKHNFNAGPSILPEVVYEKTARAILDFNGTGLSILSISHRSKEFDDVMAQADSLLRELLDIPDNYKIIFIGGGAGMAPMRSHLMHLFKTEKTKRPVSFWYGARALKEVPYLDEFHQIEKDFPNFSFNLALDRPDPEADAAGVKYTPGFVHNVLYENYLKNHQAPEDCIYLMCGPPMMIASVVKMLDNLGVPPENILYDNFGS